MNLGMRPVLPAGESVRGLLIILSKIPATA